MHGTGVKGLRFGSTKPFKKTNLKGLESCQYGTDPSPGKTKTLKVTHKFFVGTKTWILVYFEGLFTM